MSTSDASLRRLLLRYSITLTVESREDTDSVRIRATETRELLRFDLNFNGNLIRGSGLAGVVWVPSGAWNNYELKKRRCQNTLSPTSCHDP